MSYKEKLLPQDFKINKERTIPYDSPTGSAYIGVNKRPLQPVKKGFGYLGVLLQTDDRSKVQCHVCGEWFTKINIRHLRLHKLNKEKYQKKFGLLKKTALVSDLTSYRLELAGYKKYLKYGITAKDRANVAKATKESAKRKYKRVTNTEFNNRYGLCERQIGFRLIEHIRKYKSLPSISTKNEGYLIAKALKRRYGSVNEGFKHYGIPTLHRMGSTVELIAPNNKQMFFNYNKNYNREQVYQWMIDNAPILDPNAVNMFTDK